MKKILLTGFEPFGGEKINPSWEAVAGLPEKLGDIVVAKRQMPVEYDTVRTLLEQAIDEEKPEIVLCVGQAGGRFCITPEFVAINQADAEIADNAGVLRRGELILPDGPAAYFATVPVKGMVEAIRAAGVPAAVSYTAGTYVCNCIMYHLLDLLKERTPRITGGFLHIPYESGQVLTKSASTPSLSLEQMIRGLEAAVMAAAKGGGGSKEQADRSKNF